MRIRRIQRVPRRRTHLSGRFAASLRRLRLALLILHAGRAEPVRDRAQTAEDAARNRAAAHLRGQLRPTVRRVLILRGLVGHIVHDVACALLAGLDAHLTQHIFERGLCACPMKRFEEGINRKPFGQRFNSARHQSARERLLCALALLLKLVGTRTRRRRTHERAAERRIHNRKRHARHILCDADTGIHEELFGRIQPFRRLLTPVGSFGHRPRRRAVLIDGLLIGV